MVFASSKSTTSTPVEVLQQIFLLLDKSDLPALCQVNTTFRRYGSDVLYREIHAPRNLLALCHTLSMSPDLGSRVRHFEMNTKCSFSRLKHSYALISDALRSMTRLRSLKVDEPGSHAWILKACTAKLQSLFCSFDCDSNLIAFLNIQPELTELTLMGMPNGFRLDPTSLPKLHTIVAYSTWVQQLVCSRPMRKAVCLYHGDDHRAFTLEHPIFVTPTRIQTLEISTMDLAKVPFSRMSVIFPDLVNLTLVESWTTHDYEELASWTTELLSVLATLRHFSFKCVRFSNRKSVLTWVQRVTERSSALESFHSIPLAIKVRSSFGPRIATAGIRATILRTGTQWTALSDEVEQVEEREVDSDENLKWDISSD